MRIIAILFVLLLSGCATGYQPKDPNLPTGGYSDIQLDTNVFKITFQVNEFTSIDRATDFTLLRSAELALEHGFNYFVVDAQQYTKATMFTMPYYSNTIVCFRKRPQEFVYDAWLLVKSLKEKYGI